jgi:sugar phosphate isomerase/epimerase
MTAEEYFAASRELGCRYVEINVGRPPNVRHAGIDFTDAEVAALKEKAARAGVQMVAATLSNDFTTADLARLRDQIETTARAATVAARCGAEVVRVFAGWTPFEKLTTATYERCAASLRELGERCAALGVLVAVENHGGITATAAQVRRLLELADHPNVKANYDGGNFAHAKEDPLAAWNVLHDRAGYAHFKDVRPQDGALHYCALGDGISDWPPVVQAMLRDGYAGYWTIEYEEPEDCVEGTRKCIDVLRRAANG